MLAAIYARKSTEQNGVTDEAKSVTRQVDHARAYAEKKGWAVAEEHVYVDDGISGAEFERRPGLVRLMATLKPRPPFQVLIMSEPSRLGREQIETSYLLKQLISAGVEVHYYLEGRAATLDSPVDKLLATVTSFADEMEREKARQRTYDALSRKARAGHVAGGCVFGYENVEARSSDGQRQHVERRVNEAEAAVVRRIFALYAAGRGFRSIAKHLNDEGALAPQPRRTGRPRGWSPSTVRDALSRDLYRGVLVWGRKKKRDSWGRKHASHRPPDDWIRLDVPSLRIVSDDLWAAAHDRLRSARNIYLRDTAGKLYGKPCNGTESKYLLTGMATCAVCRGGLTVRRSAGQGKVRVLTYACLVHHTRGPQVCSNNLAMPVAVADRAVLTLIESVVLRPEVIVAAVEEAVARLRPADEATERQRLHAELARAEKELDHLTTAIATGGQVATLVAAVRERERQRDHLRQELTALDQLAQVARLDLAQLKQALEAKLAEWRGLLTRHVQAARQILRKVLDGRLVFTPYKDDGGYYTFEGVGRLEPILAGTVLLENQLPKALVTPERFDPFPRRKITRTLDIAA